MLWDWITKHMIRQTVAIERRRNKRNMRSDVERRYIKEEDLFYQTTRLIIKNGEIQE